MFRGLLQVEAKTSGPIAKSVLKVGLQSTPGWKDREVKTCALRGCQDGILWGEVCTHMAGKPGNVVELAVFLMPNTCQEAIRGGRLPTHPSFEDGGLSWQEGMAAGG